MRLFAALFFYIVYLAFMSEVLNAQSDILCPDSIQVTQTDIAWWSFKLNHVDASTVVTWQWDGVAVSTDTLWNQAFMAGSYLIEAEVSDADCPSTISLSYALETTACGISLQATEQESGYFTFTAVGYPEEYPMYWQLGNDTLLWETWVVDHAFSAGTHDVCAWYLTEFCPDTVAACIQVEVLPPPCTAAFIADDSMPMLLQCTSFETDPNAALMWYIDGSSVTNEANPSITLYPGVRTVCLEVSTPTCTATACDTVVIRCADPSNTVEMSVISYGNAEGYDQLILEAYNGLNTVFVENLPIAAGDTLRWIYCLDEWLDCFVLIASIDQSVALLADSMVVSAQFLANNALPTQLVLHPSGPTTVVDDVTSSDCIWWSVEEQGPIISWNIYPNPSHGNVHVSGDFEWLEVLDVSGRRLSLLNRQSMPEGLVVNDFPPGVYVVRDQDGRGRLFIVE